MPCPACEKCLTQLTGTRLEICSVFATFHTDSDRDEFLPSGFDGALASAMELGCPSCTPTSAMRVPVGYVNSLAVRGSTAAEVYAAVTPKVLDEFSVGCVPDFGPVRRRPLQNAGCGTFNATSPSPSLSWPSLGCGCL